MGLPGIVTTCLIALPPAAGAAPVTLSADAPTAQWPAAIRSNAGTVELRFTLQITGEAEGFGLVLGPAPASWAEPNVPGALGVGFDTWNPPTEDVFNGDGNVYDRPQHEVSLHWDGREAANAWSPVAFNDGQAHAVAVRVEHEVGGASVSVGIDGTPIHAAVFLPGLLPTGCRPAVGLQPRDPAARCVVEFDRPIAQGRAPLTRPPDRRTLLEGAILNAGHQQEEAEVELPVARRPWARVLLELTLSALPDGIDPWDRAGSVYVWDDAGTRLEILRCITPFGRDVTWQADVTDYQSLLRGKRKVAVAIGTWVKGWKVGVRLDYYAGRPRRWAHKVTPLWSGDLEYGNPADPLESHLPPRTVPLDPRTREATVRVVVTGHGMSPNTDNAAEFMPARRTLTVNGKAFENLLWRTDCYLTPCRPQGGTWKFDRAGWCPGSLVVPWDVDVTALGRDLALSYTPQAYTNQNAGNSRASHLFEAQLIEYR